MRRALIPQDWRFSRKRVSVRWRVSRSIEATRKPAFKRAMTMWIERVDLPVPPFSLPTTITWALRRSGGSVAGAIDDYESLRVFAHIDVIALGRGAPRAIAPRQPPARIGAKRPRHRIVAMAAEGSASAKARESQ